MNEGLQEAPRTVAAGQVVRTRDLDMGLLREVRIVPPEIADPKSGRISAESTLGRALIGRKVGDRVEARTPARTLYLSIEAVEPA